MELGIIGSSGFIGSYLSEKLKEYFKINEINLRDLNIENLNDEEITKIFSSDVLINCAASLDPKSKKDIFLNESFLRCLLNNNQKYNKIIIHFSSINVLINDRLDRYTLSKKRSEDSVKNFKNIIIIRLPLVIQRQNGIIKKKGNVSKIFNYLDNIKLPLYPMIFPGHIYQPIDIIKIKELIIDIIKEKKKSGIFNLVGEKKINLWEIFEEIAKNKKKKFLKVKSSFFFKILPEFFKLKVKKQNNFLQQIASIDHSNFN